MLQIKTVFAWMVIAVLLMVAKAIALLITPVLVLFADRKTGRLPPWAWWMETHDARLPGDMKVVRPILQRYGWWVASVIWLWRNSAYALADRFRVDPEFNRAKFRVYNAQDGIAEDGPYLPGVSLLTLRWNDRWAFELCICWPMPKGRCGFIRAGWKLADWFEGLRPQKPTATGMFQPLSIRPWQDRG